MTTVVIAGSRALPHGQAPRILIRFLAALPADAVILMRRGLNTQPGHFEAQVEHVIDMIGLALEWCQPQPGGRTEVWQRDEEMLARADLVLGFMTVDQIGDEDSGTVKLVDRAMHQDIPTYAYALEELTPGVVGVEEVGWWDPEDRWGELVPRM
jgi:hypothetical protein